MVDVNQGKGSDLSSNEEVIVAKSGPEMTEEDSVIGNAVKFELEEHSGFEPISLADATELKKICWGTASLRPVNFWLKQGFVLHPADKLFGYGVKPPANGTKNFFMAIQAYFLKHLFFESDEKEKKAKKSGRDDKSEKNLLRGSIKTDQILRPNSKGQQNMMIGGISEAIFKAADGKEAIFCMMAKKAGFEPSSNFGMDGYTEKIIISRCKSLDALKSLVAKYIDNLLMETGAGLLCFLYSLLMSRNFQRLREDLQNEIKHPLVDMRGDCHLALINLVLFGRATPYYHNGAMMIRDESGEVNERVGINDRGDIGLLLWSQDNETTGSLNVGSRLKTPVLPLWVTVCNDIVGVLFNPNKDLMRSHDAEKRFFLYYYSNFEFKEGTEKETILTVEIETNKGNVLRPFDDDENEEVPPLELLIRTKWEGCSINWNGVQPYI